VKVESKEQSRQWMHTHSPSRLRKFKHMLSSRKVMTAVFWDRKGVVKVEFMQQGTTIASQVYFKTLKKLCKAIQSKRHGMLISGVVLLHENVCLYMAACTLELLEHLNWELSDHPSYSPDAVLRNCHLFT
jgi:DNA-binding Xre family transcriptional regulator